MVCELLPTDLPVKSFYLKRKKKKNKKWMKVAVLPISISISDGPFYRRWGTF